RRADRAVLGVSAPADPDRGAGAPPPDAADGASAAWRGEHLRSRIRGGPCTTAAPGCSGSGNRRRGPGLRSPRLRALCTGLPLAGRLAAGRWAVTGSATPVATGNLLAVRGYGAVGSATRSHRVGQGFESP